MMAMRCVPPCVIEVGDDPEPGIGARIRSARELRSCTQAALARALRVDVGLLWKWEHSRRTPRLARLITISRVLGVRIDWLALGLGQMARRHVRS
jgi:transcriptional regulator with XRE-family HTH domain